MWQRLCSSGCCHTQHSALSTGQLLVAKDEARGMALQPQEAGHGPPQVRAGGPTYLGARWAWLAFVSLEERKGGSYWAQTPKSRCTNPGDIAGGDLWVFCIPSPPS